MWLKAFKVNEKSLSDLELVVLSTLPSEEFLAATDLMDHLDQEFPYWNPERGSIYPLLHRLTAQNLLVKDDHQGKKLRFKRSQDATNFLSKMITSDELLAQFNTTSKYLESLSAALIEINPFATAEFLKKFSERVEQMMIRINDLTQRAESKIKEDGWTEVDVE